MRNDFFRWLRREFSLPQPRLLIVEERERLQELYSAFFTKRGYLVSVAGNLAEAKEALSSQIFDLVLQDASLPDGDGVNFVNHIELFQPGIPVIVLSGREDDELGLQKARRNHAAGYVSKFLPLNQVLIEVRSALKRSRMARKVEHHEPSLAPAQA